MTNEDICSYVSTRMKVTDNLEQIANEVIDTCLHKGSRDNMSIIIIAFPSAPKVDPEAVKQEAELNSILEKKVTELVESHNNDVELSYVHQFLADEDIPHLPPGGGLASKKVYIEEIYKKLLPEKFEATDECPNPLASLLFTNAKNAAEAE